MKVLEYGDSGPATLFLHGFPGVRSKQNKDLAEKAAAMGRRCFVPLYSGLGQADGDFTFLSCRSDVQTFARDLLERFGSIDLVGHSWGGYLSLGIAAEAQEKIGRLVLMSPLLHFFTLDLAKQAFRMTADGNGELRLGETDVLAREFHTLGNKDRAEEYARRISTETRVSIFQAKNDDTTPASYVENLVNQFKQRPQYEVVATDHSFLIDRDRALDRVLTGLR
jgi:pimeloyl-ACP methyl ester carboxylesterase